MDSLLGIDIGSSATKVGLFSATGQALAVATYPYATATPRPLYKEQNPDDWWEAVRRGIHDVTEAFPAASVLAIGITGHISSFTFVDAAGKPLRPSIGFQDQRATQEVDELYHTFSRTELAGELSIDLPPAPTWPLPRLLWIRKHEPDMLDRTHHLLQAKDYINLRLTGTFASDPSSNRGMVDFANNQSAEAVLSRLKLPDLLPPLFEAEHVIGEVTPQAAAEMGLRPGIPVVAGWNDLNACVLGSAIVEAGQAFEVSGTSEHIGVVTAGSCIDVAPKLICAPYLHGKKLLYGVTSCGGGSLQWFSRFSDKPIAELLASAAGATDDLLFLPYLEGERSPIWDPHSSGVLLGLRSTHEEGDVTRAILEGVAFSLRQNLEIIERHAGMTLESLVVSGGASRVEPWNQIKANVLRKCMVTLENPHAGILGAAMLAAVAVKLFPNLETTAASMTQIAKRYYPLPGTRGRADRKYLIYCDVYPALQGILSRLNAESLSKSQEELSVTKKRAVVFGAGKIARGFIAHLLTLSGYHITFVEKNQALVNSLHERGKYDVVIMGAPEKNITIQNFDVYGSDDTEAVADAVSRASVIFISIGGPNLPQIAPLLAAGLKRRKTGINIVLGENYFQPAQWLRSLIAEHLTPAQQEWFMREVGIVETMILRSTVEPTEEMRAADPLSLKAQDMWEMPADKESFVGEIPPIQGLSPKENFQSGLIRKLFTYNSINAVIAYTGHLKGYSLLSEAANDPEIVDLARASYRECSDALCQRYNLNPDEQQEFAEAAIAKYQKREIVDPIERNARDPLRKLSRNDRLIGPACLALEYGSQPVALCHGIAAALLYDSPNDPSCQQLQRLVREKGISATISEVCAIDANGELAKLICTAYAELSRLSPGSEYHAVLPDLR